MHAWGIALNEVTGDFYVARPGNAEVAVLKAGSLRPTFAPTGQIPCAVAVNSRTNTVYVADYGDNTVTVVNGADGKSVATVPVGNRPQAIAVSAEENLVLVANTLGNSVTVIDGNTDRVLATIDAGKVPYALAVNTVSGMLHVANNDKKAFTILDLSRFRKQLP